jgi:acetyl-CoA synthetase
MRRLLRDVAEHRELGDVTTLLDPTVVNMIDERMRSASADDECSRRARHGWVIV